MSLSSEERLVSAIVFLCTYHLGEGNIFLKLQEFAMVLRKNILCRGIPPTWIKKKYCRLLVGEKMPIAE